MNTDTNHYNTKGIMFATGECVTSTSSFIRLWLHETNRIYGDKLIEKKDQETFSKTIVEQIKKTFSVSILNLIIVNSISTVCHNVFVPCHTCFIIFKNNF